MYAIVRLSLCLEEPLKTRVRSLLKKVGKFRKMASSSGMFVDSFYVSCVFFSFSGSVA